MLSLKANLMNLRTDRSVVRTEQHKKLRNNYFSIIVHEQDGDSLHPVLYIIIYRA